MADRRDGALNSRYPRPKSERADINGRAVRPANRSDSIVIACALLSAAKEQNMREPWLWTEDDLLLLIANGEQESLTLDYKKCDALAKTDGKKKEVSKDVSAFANSAGGVIVYGMEENGHIPTALDVGYDPNDITKEWLEQVINSSIQRKIDGVRINQVQLATYAPGKVAYIVHIPQSYRAPHQAKDWRYYKRYNFESVPMEEYEVRDCARRLEAPDLRVLLSFDADEERLTSEVVPCHLYANIKNEGPGVALYAVIWIFFEESITIGGHGNWLNINQEKVRVKGQEFVATRLRSNWMVPHDPPLFGEALRVVGCGIGYSIPNEYLFSAKIGIRVESPGMQPRETLYQFKRDGGWINIVEQP